MLESCNILSFKFVHTKFLLRKLRYHTSSKSCLYFLGKIQRMIIPRQQTIFLKKYVYNWHLLASVHIHGTKKFTKNKKIGEHVSPRTDSRVTVHHPSVVQDQQETEEALWWRGSQTGRHAWAALLCYRQLHRWR